MTLHDRIAVRAYLAWEAEGRPQGRHEAHWLAAEWAEVEADALAAHEARTIAAADAGRAKRSAAARKGAATRKANREAAAVTIAAQAVAKPARGARPVAH